MHDNFEEDDDHIPVTEEEEPDDAKNEEPEEDETTDAKNEEPENAWPELIEKVLEEEKPFDSRATDIKNMIA